MSGEVIADENEEGEEKSEAGSTKYQLIGVVVHSGQASGGHYYSYILHRSDFIAKLCFFSIIAVLPELACLCIMHRSCY